MTLQDWGAIGELIGGIAIIVSLIYVGLQVRQSTNANRAATTQAFSQQYMNLMQPLYDSEFRNIFARGLKGLGELDEGELISFFAMLGSISRMWESFYYQKGSGALDSSVFDFWILQLMDLHANEGVKVFWRIRNHQYSPEFVAYIDKMISASKPKPMYKLDDA